MKGPQHVGIILDGNRRFAKRLMKPSWKGHEWGAKKVENLLDWCLDLNIKTVTLYAFSIENLNRPKMEFNMLMKLFEKNFNRVAKHPRIHENKVRIKVIGRPDLLPEKVQKAIKNAEESTKDYSNMSIIFAIAYGGRQEILDATRKIAIAVKNNKLDASKITADVFKHNLYTNGIADPDLIIRTSGEHRTSGFLLWQGAYSEYYFCSKPWPEFEREDLEAAINDYNKRQRRFGK